MFPFRDFPIRTKLLLIIFFTSIIALAVAAFAVLVYESTTFRPRALANLTNLINLYSLNMPAPLRFDDPAAATENLATLATRSEVQKACVYEANGEVFATYDRAPAATEPKRAVEACPAPVLNQKIQFTRSRLSVLQTITQSNEIAGYFFMAADLPPLYARLPQYGIMVGVVILSLLVVSLLLSSALKRYLTMPIVHLSKTARQITHEKDYRVRAVKRQNDEVGALTESFNEMLQAIQEGQAVLKKSEAYKAGVLESALDCIITIDHEGNIQEFNPAAESTFGYSRSQVIGKEMASFIIPPSQREAHRRGLARYIETGKGVLIGRRIELTAMRAGGLEFPAEISITQIKHAGLPSFTGFVRDITESKQNEEERSHLIEQLRDSVRARDEFISIASHELRTPLTPLKLQLQILLHTIESESFRDEAKKRFLHQVIEPADRQVERLAKLVDRLLDVSRITSGQLILNLEQMNLSEFITEIVNQYRPEILKAGCSVTLVNAQTIIGYWDRLRIEQVASNLLTNAMKYGAKQPIVITLVTENNTARLSVQDSGIGIAPEDQRRVFERFERAASSRSYGGMGLGLYITRQIVLAHGGEISIQSELGKGTTFTVLLPIRTSVS